MIWNESVFAILLLALAVGFGVITGGMIAYAILDLTKRLVEVFADGVAGAARGVWALLQFRPSMDEKVEDEENPETPLRLGDVWRQVRTGQYFTILNFEGDLVRLASEGRVIERTCHTEYFRDNYTFQRCGGLI